jgi:hypothetical protein
MLADIKCSERQLQPNFGRKKNRMAHHAVFSSYVRNHAVPLSPQLIGAAGK